MCKSKFQIRYGGAEFTFSLYVHFTRQYKKLQMFYPCWTAKMVAEKKIDNDEVLKYVMEAQITSTVRGNRYQQFQIPFLRQLLLPYNEAFVKAYGITSKELLLGLEQLEYSLSSGKVDAIKDMQSMMDTFGEAVDNSSSEEEVNESIDNVRDENYGLFQKLMGLDLYDVKKVTTWSDKIISCLSYEIGNEKSLFAHDEFNGWPIWNLPIQKRPFIKINSVSYCFDYYNLFDNIYRCIQKSVCEHRPEYVNQWSHIQQIASESLVEQLFLKLLPGANAYRDNYYPKNHSLKECAENDVLIVYKDILLTQTSHLKIN